MLPKHEPSSTFGKWLLKHRLLLTIMLLLLIPVAFVMALYVGDYLKYKDVYFGDTKISEFQSTSITKEDETNHEEINYITSDLIVKLKIKSITVPEYDDLTGSYTFTSKYEKLPNRTISNVKLTLILQTEWIDDTLESDNTSRDITPSTSYGTITTYVYSKILPISPLWFVTVERPNLYVRLTYTSQIALGQTEQKTFYFKTILTGLTPSDEVDAQA